MAQSFRKSVDKLEITTTGPWPWRIHIAHRDHLNKAVSIEGEQLDDLRYLLGKVAEHIAKEG